MRGTDKRSVEWHCHVNPSKGIVTLARAGRVGGYRGPMQPLSYARHRFPPSVIQHAVWLYLRFSLCYRAVEGRANPP